MDIAKENELSRLTDTQKAFDSAFGECVKREYVKPLVDDLCASVDGFAETSMIKNANDRAFERFQLMQIENEKVGRKGDSLTLEYGGMWTVAYAGKPLGRKELSLLSDGSVFQYYRPLIYDGLSIGSRAASRDENDATVYDTETHQFLTKRRAEYELLPPAFRVALLAHYVNENVIADSVNVISFVLGCSNLQTYRWIGNYTVNKDLQRNGWVVRLRDVEPVGELGSLIAGRLKATTEKTRSEEKETHIVKTEPKKRRAGNALTFEMVECVSRILDEAYWQHEKVTHDKVHARFMNSNVSNACKGNYSSPRSMMTAFWQYAKAHPEISAKHPGVKDRYKRKER